MPTQTKTERPSLKMSLEERYAAQSCGGSYDAKSVKTANGDRMPIYSSDGAGAAITETRWTKPNFSVKMPAMLPPENDEFNKRSLDYANELGVSTNKYKP